MKGRQQGGRHRRAVRGLLLFLSHGCHGVDFYCPAASSLPFPPSTSLPPPFSLYLFLYFSLLEEGTASMALRQATSSHWRPFPFVSPPLSLRGGQGLDGPSTSHHQPLAAFPSPFIPPFSFPLFPFSSLCLAGVSNRLPEL